MGPRVGGPVVRQSEYPKQLVQEVKGVGHLESHTSITGAVEPRFCLGRQQNLPVGWLELLQNTREDTRQTALGEQTNSAYQKKQFFLLPLESSRLEEEKNNFSTL